MKKILFFVSVLLSYGAFAQSDTYFGRSAGAVGINQNAFERASTIGYNAKVSVSDGLVLGDTSLVKVGISL